MRRLRQRLLRNDPLFACAHLITFHTMNVIYISIFSTSGFTQMNTVMRLATDDEWGHTHVTTLSQSSPEATLLALRSHQYTRSPAHRRA